MRIRPEALPPIPCHLLISATPSVDPPATPKPNQHLFASFHRDPSETHHISLPPSARTRVVSRVVMVQQLV